MYSGEETGPVNSHGALIPSLFRNWPTERLMPIEYIVVDIYTRRMGIL